MFTASLAVGGASWYFAGQIDDGAFVVKHERLKRDLTIRSVSEGIVTLGFGDPEPEDLRREGTFGLVWDGGYGQVGKILDQHKDSVVREFRAVEGTPKRGAAARLDSFAFPTAASRGLTSAEVSITTPLGPSPAWRFPGTSDTWAIMVHGKGSSRAEGLRVLPAVLAAGLPSLVITYRNDEAAPAGPEKRYGYGHSEWEDIAAAMDYAQTQGARSFVLVGFSMGGGIVMALMQQPEYAALVKGLVLDAPVLDLKRTIDFRAGRRGLPRPLIFTAEAVAARRYHFDWDRFDYLDGVKELKAPMLLFHGDADRVVPVSSSDDLAQKRPDLVTYARVVDVGHVRSWNADPASYEAAVRAFLLRLR